MLRAHQPFDVCSNRLIYMLCNISPLTRVSLKLRTSDRSMIGFRCFMKRNVDSPEISWSLRDGLWTLPNLLAMNLGGWAVFWETVNPFWQVNLIVGKLRGSCADGVIQIQPPVITCKVSLEGRTTADLKKMAFHLCYTVLLKVGL